MLRKRRTLARTGRIGRRLTATLVILVSGVALATGAALFPLTGRTLDRQLGVRLQATAALVAQGLEGDVLARLQPGWETFRVYEGLRNRLLAARDAAGAARISVFDPEGRSLLDSDASVPIGGDDVRLRVDGDEVASALAGRTSHTLLFRDEAGRYAMAGYAPIFLDDRVVAGVRVDVGAGFTDIYGAFGRSVIVVAVLSSLLTGVVAVAFSRTLTRPLARLVAAARDIGLGRLDRPVPPGRADEIGDLGASIETMRRNLQDREHQLRQMLAGVAHEIGNPLGGIALHAGLIADDLEADDPRRTHIRRVIDEVATLERVLAEFTAFARPAAAVPTEVNVATVVDEVSFLLAPEIEASGVRVVVDVAGDLRAWADPDQLKRALVNLMKNAVQAMPGGGELAVTGALQNGRVAVDVRDTGAGIPADVRDRLFEPFFTTRQKGSGLGLVVTKRIAEENDGSLTVESREGEGTLFRLDLPGAASKESA